MNLIKDLPILNHLKRFRDGFLQHLRKFYNFGTAHVSEKESFKILVTSSLIRWAFHGHHCIPRALEVEHYTVTAQTIYST